MSSSMVNTLSQMWQPYCLVNRGRDWKSWLYYLNLSQSDQSE